MNESEFFEALVRYQDGGLSPEATAALERILRADPGRRRQFAEWQLRSAALHDHFRREAYRVSFVSGEPERTNLPRSLRPALAAAAGLALGLFGASVVWAIATPEWVATASRVAGLRDGGFEEGAVGRIGTGFPREAGHWSGDEAALVDLPGAPEGHRALEFLSPGADEAAPGGRAISCDVFQIVDLRSVRGAGEGEDEAQLELSALCRDGRATGARPSVTFMAQIFLFSGDPARLHQAWPNNIGEALASGAAFVHASGETAPQWHRLGAKCLVPREADFAVIQLAARPNLRPAVLESLFADQVKLTLTTRPPLPVKVVEQPKRPPGG
jgi:hypothetical protein